jgi:purine-binding chemotaxis protein CheW
MACAPRKPDGARNWDEVRRRLVQAASMEANPRSPERARALMDERARFLARVPAETVPAAAMLEVVTFHLAGERYAIEAPHVREVIRLIELTPLPGAPDFFAGVTNLRGHILAVIDLGKFFGLADKGLTDLTRVIVLGAERAEFGILADAAPEVTRLRADQVLEALGSVAGKDALALRGVTAEALLLLDGAALLQDPRLFIDQGEGEVSHG